MALAGTAARRVLKRDPSTAGLLTLTGDLVNDAYRDLGVEGDGATTPTRRTGVYGVIENLIYSENTSLNDTTFVATKGNWGDGNDSTAARSTAEVFFGVASLICTFDGDASTTTLHQYSNLTFTNAAHYWSGWLFIPTGFTGTQVLADITSLTGVTGTTSVNANMSLKGEWQRFDCGPFTPDAGDLSGTIRIRCTGQQPNESVYLSGPMVVQSSIPLPFHSTAATAGRIQVPSTGMSGATGAVACRLTMRFASTDVPTSNPPVMEWYLDTNNRIELEYATSDDSWQCVRGGLGTFGNARHAGTGSWATGNTQTVIGKWDSAKVYEANNGSSFNSSGSAVVPALVSAIDLGSQVKTAGQIYSDIHWVAIYGPGGALLGDGDSAYIDSLGNDASWEDLPLKEHLVGFWDGAANTYWSFV